MKSDRHTTVEVQCETCGNSFMARRERVLKGQGRFCCKECFDVWQREQKSVTVWGRKDLAKVYNVGGKYTVRWYDSDGNIKSTTYARWWWEMNIGEIPNGMIILHKDGNPSNIDPDNFEIGEKSEALRRGNANRKLDITKWNSYLDKQSTNQKARWGEGKFSHITGSGHYKWRGGTSKEEYPEEFYEIRDFIKSRDGHMCQVCGKRTDATPRFGHVHHRDGNKNNSDQDNLILLCVVCHSKVHATSPSSLPIMALRSELHWNR